MAKYIVSLQRTSNAFGSNQDIPEHLWYEISRHTSVSAARKAQKKHLEEMHAVTGPSGWTHNTRLIALRDIKLHVEFICSGSCYRSTNVPFRWPAGETCPESPALPIGWAREGSEIYCDHPKCQEAQRKEVARQNKELSSLERDLHEREAKEEALLQTEWDKENKLMAGRVQEEERKWRQHHAQAVAAEVARLRSIPLDKPIIDAQLAAIVKGIACLQYKGGMPLGDWRREFIAGKHADLAAQYVNSDWIFERVKNCVKGGFNG